MKRLSYFVCMTLMIFLGGCSVDKLSNDDVEGAIDFTINPTIQDAQSRLDVDKTNSATTGTDGRDAFVTNDKIVLTKIARTSYPLSAFSYSDIGYTRNESGGWVFDESNTTKKLYWTDTNEHTIIGYSLPIGASAWTGTDTYTKTLATDQSDVTKFKLQDVLLSYSTAIKASTTTSLAAADIDFHHGLAKVQTKVVLSGFASSGSADGSTKMTSLSITGQPTNYTWDKKSYVITAVDGTGENATVNLWNALSQGTDNDKLFLGYGLLVPGKRSFDINMQLTYPDALDNTKTVTKDYKASFADITFVAGKRTTLTITLNHQNGIITATCTLADWEDITDESSHQDELLKYGTFLQTVDMSGIKLATDVTKAEYATWLYTNSSTVTDRYGNTGTITSPFEIRNAYDILALAKEVNNGRTFEGQYVKLSADQYLQADNSSSTLVWPGIGDSSHSFAGTFNGNGKALYSLQGNALFTSLASTAKVYNLTVTTYKTGNVTTAMLCETNNGVIEGCSTIGTIKGTANTGGIAVTNTNTGSILASYHQGDISGNSIGGIVNSNAGKIVACYHGRGYITGTTTGGVCASNTGTITSCYYDKTNASNTPNAINGKTDTSDVTGMKLTDMEGSTFVTTLNNAISTWNNSNTKISATYSLVLSNLPILKE